MLDKNSPSGYVDRGYVNSYRDTPEARAWIAKNELTECGARCVKVRGDKILVCTFNYIASRDAFILRDPDWHKTL